MIRRAALILIVILCASFTWARSQEVPDSAMMYQTQEIWQQVDKQQTELDQQGFIAAFLVILVMLVCFLIITQLRHRSSVRLEEANERL